MSRRKAAPKRSILPDPLFKSELLAKFINSVMDSGKKSVAERIVYGALDEIMNRTKKSKQQDDEGEGGSSGSAGGNIRTSDSAREKALEMFKQALDNVMPSVEVKSRRVGGSTYQVPIEIRGARRMALAMRWMVEYAGKRGEKTMKERLAAEMIDAIEGRGGAVKKREDVHRMAKANQAFAHYRW
ncbi:MAG: 30S ribosomal protein S7 [Coxiellaceae bacterium]|nr:30S ribosomal protein S7 [Coxiellaceae bacterium]